MIDWIENMGIDEDEFLRRCGGTYKLAIRFDDWITTKHRYWHPFGICGVNIDGIDLVHFWQRGINEGWLDPTTKYTDFSLQKQLCDMASSPRPLNGPPVIANYAYHLDASRFAVFLSELATGQGVKHRVGDVVGAARCEDGSISQVLIRDQEPLEADLYIDCSGFSSVLIERSLQEPWIDWSDQLLCDRAVAVRMPVAPSNTLPYTISTGLKAGWSWQIPLRENTGAGYVYSSKHIDSETARRELLQHVGLSEQDAATRELVMRVGRRERSWVHNCVSIGLSSGFVEPLESTGIFLVQRALDDLVDCLPQQVDQPPNIEEFNQRLKVNYEEIRDFVLLHYVVSKRSDSSFWRAARQVELPDSLASAMQRYVSHGEVHLPSDTSVFAEANHHFIMTGADRLPASMRHNVEHANVAQPFIKRYDSRDFQRLFAQLRSQHNQYSVALPKHRDVIDRINLVKPNFACL